MHDPAEGLEDLAQHEGHEVPEDEQELHEDRGDLEDDPWELGDREYLGDQEDQEEELEGEDELQQEGLGEEFIIFWARPVWILL